MANHNRPNTKIGAEELEQRRRAHNERVREMDNATLIKYGVTSRSSANKVLEEIHRKYLDAILATDKAKRDYVILLSAVRREENREGDRKGR